MITAYFIHGTLDCTKKRIPKDQDVYTHGVSEFFDTPEGGVDCKMRHERYKKFAILTTRFGERVAVFAFMEEIE